MKKQLILAAVAVVAMASCAKNEAVETSSADSSAIEMTAFVDRATKGSVSTITELESTGFKAYGVISTDSEWSSSSDNTAALDGVEVTNSNGIWSYSNTASWTAEDTEYISTWAFSPYGEDVIMSASTTSSPSVTFTVADELLSQVDFLTAYTMNTAQYSTIDLAFGHALAKIGFTAQQDTELETGADQVQISKVEIASEEAGVYSTGTYKFGNATEASEWLSLTGELNLASTEISADKLAASPILTDTALNVTDTDCYLMIIPQTISADGITVTVTYECQDNGGTAVNGADTEKSVTLPAMAFEEGKQYTFNLLVGGDADAIKFGSITIGDFADGDGSNL